MSMICVRSKKLDHATQMIAIRYFSRSFIFIIETLAIDLTIHSRVLCLFHSTNRSCSCVNTKTNQPPSPLAEQLIDNFRKPRLASGGRMAQTLEQEVNLSRRACWKHSGQLASSNVEFNILDSQINVCLLRPRCFTFSFAILRRKKLPTAVMYLMGFAILISRR